MPKWDHITKQAWEQSETAMEFEKYILSLAERLDLMAQASTLDTVNQKATEVKNTMGDAKKSLDAFVDSALADDAETNPELEEISEEEQKEAKAKLLLELKLAAEAAADLGNIKLAYRIERTISEISGE